MKAHRNHLINRILRAALRSPCRFKVVAVGIDYRGRVIGIATNTPRMPNRGWHAEERLIKRCPKSLSRIVLARVGNGGEFLKIDPCEQCLRLIDKCGLTVEMLT